MVMGAVVAARIAGDRLEEVGPPHRPVDHDRLGRVDRARQGRPLQQTHLDAHPSLGALLAGRRIRIDEVQVAGDHADAFEAPRVQHGVTLSGRPLLRRPTRPAAGPAATPQWPHSPKALLPQGPTSPRPYSPRRGNTARCESWSPTTTASTPRASTCWPGP